jgi:membrane fusion protein (multidrug efflux system)
VALDPIEVEFSVAERDSARVAVGQPVYVNVDPYPSEKFVGNVSAVSPVIDPSTRTMRVKARIPNTDGRLRPGLFARTDLGVARRDHVVFVPAEAVLQRSDGEVVFVVGDDQRARRVVVKTGVQRDGRVEILDGVKGAEAIVVRGQGTLSAGALVKRTQPDALDEQPPGGAELPGASLASEQPAAGSAR